MSTDLQPTNCIVLTLDQLNTNLQAEKLQLDTLYRSLHKLLSDVLIRFVLPSAFLGKKEGRVLFNDVLNTFIYGYMALDIW